MRRKKFLTKGDLVSPVGAVAKKYGVSKNTIWRAKARPDHSFWVGYHEKEVAPDPEWVEENTMLLLDIARKAAWKAVGRLLKTFPGDPHPLRVFTIEDATHEAYLAMVEKSGLRPKRSEFRPERYDFNGALEAWLFKVAMHGAMNFIKKHLFRLSREVHPDLATETEEASSFSSFSYDPFAEQEEFSNEMNWVRERKEEALAVLDDEERQIFLAACAGWDQEEITLLGDSLTPTKVLSRLKKIIQKIRGGIEGGNHFWFPPRRNDDDLELRTLRRKVAEYVKTSSSKSKNENKKPAEQASEAGEWVLI